MIIWHITVVHESMKNATGKRFTTNCSCIHVTGSVRGMVKLGFWSKYSDKVRHGNWIYQQP